MKEGARPLRVSAALLLGSVLSSGCLVGDPNPYEGLPGTGGTGTGGTGTTGGLGNDPDSAPLPGLRRGSPPGAAIAAGSDCSVGSSTGVRLVVTNELDRALSILWVDYQCQERSYGTLAVGGRFETTTYATHPWRFRDATTSELLFEYLANETPEQIVSLP